MDGMLILLFIVFIVGGLLQFFAADWLWEGQVRTNEMNGITQSERTEAWDTRRKVMGIFMMVVAAGFGLLGLYTQRSTSLSSVGQYICMPDSAISESYGTALMPYIDSSAAYRTTLNIMNGGQATFGGQALTWTYDGGRNRVVFSEDTSLEYGQFEPKGNTERFVIHLSYGTTQICLRR
jgi:hypothetical protein